MKPSIFIASSSSALKLARAVKEELEQSFEPDIWDEHLFELGEDTLSNLLRFAKLYDFGVFLITADDLTTSKKTTSKAPRDNVILELGMFMGAIGSRRAFPIVAMTKDGPPKLPSDLLGNTAVYLPKGLGENPTPAAIRKELKGMVSAIQSRAKEAVLQLLPSTALAIGYFNNFLMPVCKELAQRDYVEISGKQVDIRADNFDVTIVLPKTLSDATGPRSAS